MDTKLTRDYSLTNALRWNACKVFVEANWEAFLVSGNPLRVIVSTEEETRRNRQNKFYFKGVIEQITEQAMVDGKKFGKLAWHLHYAGKFAPIEEIKLPDGRTIARRKSTTDMKVKEFSEYTEQVMADAASEHGVLFYIKEE